jgi:restriction endonuclease S subunit
MDTFTQNIYTNYYDKKTLNTKTKEELIELYINDFNVVPNAQAKLLTKIKTKDDIIKLILTQRDSQYIKLIKKTYGKHKNEYTGFCNGFTTGKLNDETKSVRDRIHAIHDFIRNKGFGYGMTGLKLFNLFYGLLQIENSGLLQKWAFSDETLENTNLTNDALIKKLSFTEIYKFVDSYHEVKDKETNKCEEIAILIKEMCKLLSKFSKGEDTKLKNLIYYDLSHIKANAIDVKTLLNLISELDELTVSSNIQLGGKIYEYFIGRDQSAISELGAYFTDRHLVNYIFENILELQNTIDVNNLPKVCDMFGGSGGFTINFIVYVNKILKSQGYSQKDDIYKFWEGKNIKKVNHYDVNQDVVNNAKLEAFCLTHQLIGKCNFDTRNSFTEEYCGKYKLIISNPPYGGDKSSETTEMKEYKTIIEYNKNLLYNDFDDDMTQEQRSKLLIQNTLLDAEIKHLKDAQKTKCINYASCSTFIRDYCNKITDYHNEYLNSIGKKGNKSRGDGFNDKESCSLVLLMAVCDKGGRVLGVLKEGVFFDSKYAHIRRYLLTHFIVKRVDSNPSNTFENTTTNTSNILFELPEDGIIPNNYNVKFYDVEVIKNTKDEFNTENSFTLLNSASNGTIKEINNINEKIVSVKTILANDECSFNSKLYNIKPLVAGEGFKMVKLGDVCEINPSINKKFEKNNTYKYVEISDINDFNINNFTVFNINDIKTTYKKVLKNDILISSVRPKKNKILYLNNLHNMDEYFFSKALVILRSKENYNNLYTMFSIYNILNDLEKQICNGSSYPRFKPNDLKSLELPIPDTEEQIQYWVNYISDPYNKIQDTRTRLTTLETQVQTDIQNILDNNECEEVMLGDLCEFKNGTSLSKNNIVKGIYPVIGGGKIPYGYHNKYNCARNTILCSSSGSAGFISIYKSKVWASDCFSIIPKDLKYNNTYYYLLKIFYQNDIYNIKEGSVQPHVYSKYLSKIKIQLPKDRLVLDTLNPVFEEIDSLNEELPKQEGLYNTRLEELRSKAILED